MSSSNDKPSALVLNGVTINVDKLDTFLLEYEKAKLLNEAVASNEIFYEGHGVVKLFDRDSDSKH